MEDDKSEKFWPSKPSKKHVWKATDRPEIEATSFTEAHLMPSIPVVTTDLAVQIGSRKVPLTPSAAFALAEQLIRGATRAIVQSEADRALVLDTVRDAAN